MTDRLLITFGVLLYAVAVPWLELDDTHLFNPLWPPHARLHEAWQLITNCALGLAALWLAWVRGATRQAAGIALLVMGGFLVALLLQDLYGGSMRHNDGTERTVLGLNTGVLGAALAVLAAALVLWRTRGTPAGERRHA
ncbi:MAG: hypothetical protein ACOY3X_04575 [Pseudomonadota bacterium]